MITQQPHQLMAAIQVVSRLLLLTLGPGIPCSPGWPLGPTGPLLPWCPGWPGAPRAPDEPYIK